MVGGKHQSVLSSVMLFFRHLHPPPSAARPLCYAKQQLALVLCTSGWTGWQHSKEGRVVLTGPLGQ